ncbi:hypothetical protein [Methylocucumis oryzae]|uniref:Uncharacterized protein n=1 Tax=Methylocucumis oryzae TaxID=1632867 RepID=A0A0F3IND0_9GAMM|nr:hypothetical protein [Methylocucumis oryzae]KJV08063.1 hypothetical protein VZ94_00445 [Methylocucumis oryzae]
MDLESKDGIGLIVGSVVTAIPVIFIGFKKLFLQSKIADTQIASTEANKDVITMLRDEIKRVDEQYQEAIKRVNEIHTENLKLRAENSTLTSQIMRLNETIEELKTEIEGIGRRKNDSK